MLQSVTHTLQEALSCERVGVWRHGCHLPPYRLATCKEKYLATSSDWGRRRDAFDVFILHTHVYKQHVSHQPFNLQGEEGGEEEECPNDRTDDETQPKYPASVLMLFPCSPAHTYSMSCILGVKHPEALSILINPIPPAQPYQQPASLHSETKDKCK